MHPFEGQMVPFRKKEKNSPEVRNTSRHGEMLSFGKNTHRTRWTTLSHPLGAITPPPALPPVRAYNPAASPPGGPNLRGIRMRRDRMNAYNVCTGDAAIEIATASLALTSMWGVVWVAS